MESPKPHSTGPEYIKPAEEYAPEEAFETVLTALYILSPGSRAIREMEEMKKAFESASDSRFHDMAPKADYHSPGSALLASMPQYGSAVQGLQYGWAAFHEDPEKYYNILKLQLIEPDGHSVGGLEGLYIARHKVTKELIPFDLYRQPSEQQRYVVHTDIPQTQGLYAELARGAVVCQELLATTPHYFPRVTLSVPNKTTITLTPRSDEKRL